MNFFQSNIQTSVLVLIVILLCIVCITLFFTNKEVRNLKTSTVKNQHDIEALQTLLSDVGMKATGVTPVSSFGVTPVTSFESTISTPSPVSANFFQFTCLALFYSVLSQDTMSTR